MELEVPVPKPGPRMVKTLNLYEAKTRLSSLVEEAANRGFPSTTRTPSIECSSPRRWPKA